jgi:5-methylcytosine-specific restriction endonuclease McrA
MINSKVLLLNASYEAIKTIPMQRAIVLVVEGKAEITEADRGFIRSPSVTLAVPSVIRLLKYVYMPAKKRNIPISRRAILNRDSKECAYCGKEADTIDHIHPRSKGGRHEWLNVIAACKKCNAKKGSKTLKEIGWKLRFDPIDPLDRRWSIAGISNPEWHKYIND